MPHYYDSPEPKAPTDRLCLTDDRMVPCPVAGLEAALDEAHVWKFDNAQPLSLVERLRVLVSQRDRLREQRNAAEAQVDRLNAEATEYNRGLAGLTSVVEATTAQTNRLLARARASDAQVDRLRRDLSDSTAQLILDDDVVLSLQQEVERLRGMVRYALDGPDEDLPEPLGGRVVVGVKKILRDALSGEGAGEPEDVCACFHDRRFHHSSGYRPYQCSVDGCDCLVFSEGVE